MKDYNVLPTDWEGYPKREQVQEQGLPQGEANLFCGD